MIRKLLVPVRGDGMAEAVLSHAAALARLHGAHIVVAHCRPRAEDLVPYSVPLPAFARDTIMAQAKELADQQEQGVRDELHRIAGELGLEETGAPVPGRATMEFVEEAGRMADVIKHNGRLADLVVVGRPDRDRNIGGNALKAALFRTGRPVLMCPPARPVPEGFGTRLAVAWNGSLEASRAVAMTLDLVAKAEAVTILSGGKGEPHGASAEELAQYYGLRGIGAAIHRFEARNPGAALLDLTAEIGANMLVMGAYGQTHERETLFGGNTQTVVDKAEIPTVLVH